MKTSWAGVALLLAGLSIFVGTLVAVGSPLGYRGYLALTIEVVGLAELKAGDGPPRRLERGRPIAPGDEIHTASFSTATVRCPAGEITLLDGSTLISRAADPSSGPQWLLHAGRARVQVAPGQQLSFGTPLATGSVQLGEGIHLLAADGKGQISGGAVEGDLTVRSGSGVQRRLGAGQVFHLAAMAEPVVETTPAEPALKVSASGPPRAPTATLSGSVPPGSRLYVDGVLTYAEANKSFTVPFPAGQAHATVVVEDARGRCSRSVVPLQPAP